MPLKDGSSSARQEFFSIPKIGFKSINGENPSPVEPLWVNKPAERE